MDITKQILAARGAVLAVPTGRAVLVVTGRDAVTWLNGLVTCDLNRLSASPGAGSAAPAVYGLAVGRSGRIITDLVVVRDGDRLLLSVPAGHAPTLAEHFEHHRIMEDAEVLDASGTFSFWALHGPRAPVALDGLVRAGGLGGDLDRTGLGGAGVFVPREGPPDGFAKPVEDAAGVIGDASGWHHLRLERAVPEIGEDFDEKTYPQEAGVEHAAVSFDKGCYLGQEVVFMLEHRGHVNRKIAALVLDSGAPPDRGTPVADATGAPVGEITSSAFSPTVSRAVALAMIKTKALDRLPLSVGGARATVVDRPA